jgi:hypothetical protein
VVRHFRWLFSGSQGSHEYTRRQPISARDAQGCWTEAMRTSENAVKRKFNFREFPFHALT